MKQEHILQILIDEFRHCGADVVEVFGKFFARFVIRVEVSGEEDHDLHMFPVALEFLIGYPGAEFRNDIGIVGMAPDAVDDEALERGVQHLKVGERFGELGGVEMVVDKLALVALIATLRSSGAVAVQFLALQKNNAPVCYQCC